MLAPRRIQFDCVAIVAEPNNSSLSLNLTPLGTRNRLRWLPFGNRRRGPKQPPAGTAKTNRREQTCQPHEHRGLGRTTPLAVVIVALYYRVSFFRSIQ